MVLSFDQSVGCWGSTAVLKVHESQIYTFWETDRVNLQFCGIRKEGVSFTAAGFYINSSRKRP